MTTSLAGRSNKIGAPMFRQQLLQNRKFMERQYKDTVSVCSSGPPMTRVSVDTNRNTTLPMFRHKPPQNRKFMEHQHKDTESVCSSGPPMTRVSVDTNRNTTLPMFRLKPPHLFFVAVYFGSLFFYFCLIVLISYLTSLGKPKTKTFHLKEIRPQKEKCLCEDGWKYLSTSNDCEIKPQKEKCLCEDGWQYLSTSNDCVKSFERRLTWLEAQRYCVKNGSNLTSIHSTMENVILHNLFSPDGSNKTLWIGSSAPNFDEKYGWIDGSPMKYSLFGTASLGWHFHCTIIVGDNFFRWRNVDCDLRYSFICRKPRN
uniref:C-type lectin domain-containing protein n=1 Tax=Steinernema glaseri TaxID=37863 RepID=A0A1I7YWX1_9BILA